MWLPCYSVRRGGVPGRGVVAACSCYGSSVPHRVRCAEQLVIPDRLACDQRVDPVKHDCEQHPKDRREEEAAHDFGYRVGTEVAGWSGVAGPRIVEALVLFLKGRERW